MTSTTSGDRVVVEPARTTEAGSRPVVLFDFDGVLLHGDAFTLFIHDRYRRAWWRVLAGIPLLPLLGILSCRRRGRLAAGRLLARVALLGVDEHRYEALVNRFAERLVKASRRVSRMAVASLRQQLHAGARVVIVSGCEEHLLRAILAELGIAGIDVIASQVAWHFSGMRVVWHNVGTRKIERLASYGIVPPWDVAISDSSSDLPILSAARDPVLVNAAPRLCRRVEKALGRSVRRVEWD